MKKSKKLLIGAALACLVTSSEVALPTKELSIPANRSYDNKDPNRKKFGSSNLTKGSSKCSSKNSKNSKKRKGK